MKCVTIKLFVVNSVELTLLFYLKSAIFDHQQVYLACSVVIRASEVISGHFGRNSTIFKCFSQRCFLLHYFCIFHLRSAFSPALKNPGFPLSDTPMSYFIKFLISKFFDCLEFPTKKTRVFDKNARKSRLLVFRDYITRHACSELSKSCE